MKSFLKSFVGHARATSFRIKVAAPDSLRPHLIPDRYRAKVAELQKWSNSDSHGYSLAPFDKMGCIFVHIPKCAGVSITKSLFGCLAGGHTSVEEYLYHYGSKEFAQRFTFTIVRNPYDRIASAYSFLLRGGMNQADTAFSMQHLSDTEDFNDFVQRKLRNSSVFWYWHFRPQMWYLRDPRTGGVGVDYVGRVETIQSDFDFISSRLGSNGSLENLNSSRSTSYPMDECSRQIIADLYREDFRMLSYQR